MKSLKALISKKTIHRAHIAHLIPLKKSELQDGDLVQQKDGEIGIYISDLGPSGFTYFKLSGPAEETLVFHSNSGDEIFCHYPIRYYKDNLKDKDNEANYDAIKIIRGLFNPKDVNDPKKVKEFLENESNYKNYFI